MSAKINPKQQGHRIGWLMLAVAAIWTGLNCRQQPIQSGDLSPAALPDQLLQVNSAEHGFQLAFGAWQFPDLNWTISQQLTTAAPEQWLQAKQREAVPSGSQPPSPGVSPLAETELDQQIRGLVQGLMQPRETEGGWGVYAIDGAGLRGVAISAGIDDSKPILAICLQWPAEDGQWTQLVLERLRASPRMEPLTALPMGTQVTAQRSDRDGRVQVQVVQGNDSSADLRQYLVSHGWSLTEQNDGEPVFWARTEGRLLEFNCQASESGGSTVLIRELEHGERQTQQIAAEF